MAEFMEEMVMTGFLWIGAVGAIPVKAIIPSILMVVLYMLKPAELIQ